VLEGLQDATPVDARIESVSVTPAAPALEVAPAPAPDPGTAGGEEGTEAPAEEVPPPATSSTSPCPGPDPFSTRVVVGCVTVSGSASSRDDVGDLVVRLGEDPLFVEPFISTTTTADEEQVTFSGSVGISPKVYSRRYADLERLLATGGRP
jgi:hypothetical protein